MPEIKIVTIYESASTDGYTGFGDGIFFTEKNLAENRSKSKHGNYSTRPFSHLAIEIETGKYILVKSENPVCIEDGVAEKEAQKQNALSKLSDYEKEILGLIKIVEDKP